MNIILYNAISLDGFIATLDGDSDWVSDVDAEVFEAKCKDAGCIKELGEGLVLVHHAITDS